MQRVMVLARDPLWTPTAVVVRKGERVHVQAFGSVQPHAVAHDVWRSTGPSGYRNLRLHPHAQSMNRLLPHAALLAVVSPRRFVRPLRAHPSHVVLVGAHRSFDAPRSGLLLLGLNDTKTEDNRGYFAATVTVWSR